MRKTISLLLLCIFLCLQLTFSASAFNPDDEKPDHLGYIIQLTSPLPSLFHLGEQPLPLQEIYAPLGLYALEDPAYLDELREADLISYAEPDYIVELFVEETSSLDVLTGSAYDLWHLDMLGTSHGNDHGCFGQDIRVAVIDSGATSHVDLSANLLPGYNFLTDTADVTDNIGHGTFVSGLIGADDNGFGVTGAAPDVEILPLKCFDNGISTTVSTICRAIYAAVDEYDCQILNMSFGIKKYSETFETAINYAADNGVITVASAGNLGDSTLYYPAAFENVIGVGAVDEQGAVASFSQRNDSVLIVAPGKSVYSTTNTGEYAKKSGTSFSAPLVSGALARLLNTNPSLTVVDVISLLTNTAKDLGEEGYDTSYGYGLLSLPDLFASRLQDTSVFLSPFRRLDSTRQISIVNSGSEHFTGQCFYVEYVSSYWCPC